MIDASIILNLHREGVFLQRTLLSLDDAVRFASDNGLRCELIVVLDRADERTMSVVRRFDLSVYAAVQVLEVDNGSLGLSRNDGIAVARGAYILTADGDDLISRNFIREVVKAARMGPKNCLYFPEFLLGFGESYYISIYRSLKDVTPFAFIDMHPYISRICAHRSVFQQFSYDDHRLSKGYAFEDWHFNAEAVGQGFDIRVVLDTVLFYRQRSNSLLQQANAHSSKQIAPSSLFDPTTYLGVCAPFANEVLATANTSLRAQAASHDILDRSAVRDAVRQVNAIEPSIRLSIYRDRVAFTNAQNPLDCGIAYYRICELVTNLRFDEVFLFPFISRGGAERYFLEIINAIYRLAPERDILVLLGEDFTGASWQDRLPPNVTVLDLQYFGNDLPLQARLIIALKLTQTVASGARIHIRQSHFGDSFLRAFGAIFSESRMIYYRFADDEGIDGGELVIRYSPLELISDSIDYLSHIITDNEAVVRKDIRRIGTDSYKWHVLPAPIEIKSSAAPSVGRGVNRVLWASRLDYVKRVTVLPIIARHLTEKRESAIQIDAYGASVFGQHGPELLSGHENLAYLGPFDGFNALPVKDYPIFVYTSWCDGIPNILLEAMAAGIVVIAPDVGGISEIVKNNETGILIKSSPDDEVMARRYVEEVVRLLADQSLVVQLAKNALKFLKETRSYDIYDRMISELFLQG